MDDKADEVVLVELIYDDGENEPHICGQEGVFPDVSSARAWVANTWPVHRDHGHVIEINPQRVDGNHGSIFASFVPLPFGRGWTSRAALRDQTDARKGD